MFKWVDSLERFWFFLLCCLTCFPILPRGVESINIILIVAVSLLLVTQREGRISSLNKIEWQTAIILSALPVSFFFSLSYTENITEGFNQFLRIVPLLIFPLVFLFVRKSRLNDKELSIIKIIFVISVFLALLRLQIILFEPLYKPNFNHWELRQLIEKHSDVHGTYLSIWTGFAILVTASVRAGQVRINKYIYFLFTTLIIGFFFYWQIKIGARAPLIATTLLLVMYFVIRLRRNLLQLSLFLLLVVSGIYYLSNKMEIYERITNALNWEGHKLPDGDYSYRYKDISSEDIRKGIYLCTWKLASNSPWLGYGLGDVQDQLNECYSQNIPSNVYQKFLFNTHNQYFHAILVGGIITLISLLASLLWPLILSLKNKDFLLFSITGLIAICFFTENIIGRHDGVIFYSLFISMFTFNCIKRHRKN
ncbi:MAG: O-antigen ligase family protein [Eudoraea sp.]|nr:O-antigen ligase family protein [Eudoraea sp.]